MYALQLQITMPHFSSLPLSSVEKATCGRTDGETIRVACLLRDPKKVILLLIKYDLRVDKNTLYDGKFLSAKWFYWNSYSARMLVDFFHFNAHSLGIYTGNNEIAWLWNRSTVMWIFERMNNPVYTNPEHANLTKRSVLSKYFYAWLGFMDWDFTSDFLLLINSQYFVFIVHRNVQMSA